jgi:hypothetical protein
MSSIDLTTEIQTLTELYESKGMTNLEAVNRATDMVALKLKASDNQSNVSGNDNIH